MTNSQSDFPLNDQNFQADLLKIKKVFADLITQASDGKIPIRSSHVHGLHHFKELYIRARAGMCSVWDIRSWLFQLSQLKSPAQAFLERFLQNWNVLQMNKITFWKLKMYCLPIPQIPYSRRFCFPSEPWMCGSGYWFKYPQVLHENIELLSV